jgi:hypothetical protein
MSKITSLGTFIDEIIKISGKKKHEDYTPFYRGESADFGESRCQPGIFRKSSLIKNEHNLFKEFITLNADEFTDDKLAIDKLTKMQHYGLPTRLLDLTSNALLALYMALDSPDKKCKEDKEQDPFVYIFFIPKKDIKFYDSDTVSVLANLAKREKFDFPRQFESNNVKFNKDPNIQYLLHNIKDEKPYFKDAIEPKHLYSVVCIKPLQNNKRIIRQQGLFLIFGNDKNNKLKPAKLQDSGIVIEHVVIDKKEKNDLLEQLKSVGLSKEVVYPDMEKVAMSLKEKYSKE